MLRLVLLLLYLAASYSATTHLQGGGGLDPDGSHAQPPPTATTDGGGGLDPDGRNALRPHTGDIGGGLDPNG
jgi:hypothetical protein